MQALSPAERESAYRSGQQAFAQSVTDTIKKDPGEGNVIKLRKTKRIRFRNKLGSFCFCNI